MLGLTRKGGRLLRRPIWPFRINPASDLSRGLTDCWPLTNGGGTTPNIARKAAGGTWSGVPVRGISPYGGGQLTFVAPACVDCGTLPLPDAVTQFSMGMWCRRTASNSVMALGKSISGTSATYFIFYNDGNVYVQTSSNFSTNYGQFASNVTTWVRALMVYDGSQATDLLRLKFYLNGVLQSLSITGTVPSTSASIAANFKIGRSDVDGLGGDGDCSDAMVWNRALTATEAVVDWAPQTRWDIYAKPKRSIWISSATGIQFDAASNSGYQAAASTYNWNHTWTGSSLGIGVDVEILSVPGTTVTSVTFNGVALLFVVGQSTITTSLGRVESWAATASQLGGLAAGTYSIVVTLSASVASAGTAASYTGIHQTSPTEGAAGSQATNTGVGNNASLTLVSLANNGWPHAAIVTDDGSVTAGQNSRNNVTGLLGTGANEDTGPVTPAGSTNMTYTGLGITATWAMSGYVWRPVTAPGLFSWFDMVVAPTAPPQRTVMLGY